MNKTKSLLKKFQAMEEDAVWRFAGISKKSFLIRMVERFARVNRSLRSLNEMAKDNGFADRKSFLRSLRIRDLADIFTDEVRGRHEY